MARRTAKAEAIADEATETTTEATEAPVSKSPKKGTNKKEKVVSDDTATPEVEFDLTEFTASVNSALESADKSTGTPTPEAVTEVNAKYREIEGQKGKNAAKTSLEAGMMAALDPKSEDYASLDSNERLIVARTFMSLKEKLSAAGARAPKAPVDPTDAFVERVVALRLAYADVASSAPEGVAEDWSAKADALAAEVSTQYAEHKAWVAGGSEGDAPEVAPVVRAAFKVATGKGVGGARKPFTGTRRNVLTHIQQVFADEPTGTFKTITEIARTKSTEYGDDPVSPGAVSGRFFKKGEDGNDVPQTIGDLRGVIPTEGARGVEKV